MTFGDQVRAVSRGSFTVFSESPVCQVDTIGTRDILNLFVAENKSKCLVLLVLPRDSTTTWGCQPKCAPKWRWTPPACTATAKPRKFWGIFYQRTPRFVKSARDRCQCFTTVEHGWCCRCPGRRFIVASKVNPFPTYGESLTPESVKAQAAAILESLKMPKVDILYLHAPDIHTPVEATLAGAYVC
jgi:hypothetical protein